MKTADPDQSNKIIFTELYYKVNEFMKTFGSLFSEQLIVAGDPSAECPYVKL